MNHAAPSSASLLIRGSRPGELERVLSDACRVLLQLTDACYGPQGRCKVIVRDVADCEFDLTSASGPVLASLALDHPLVHLLVRRTALDQSDSTADGGWLALRLAATAVCAGLQFTATADRLQFLRAYSDAMQLCVRLLEPPGTFTHTDGPSNARSQASAATGRPGSDPRDSLAMFLDIGNLPCLIALLRAFLYPRRPPEFSASDTDLLCVTIAQAFFQSLDATHPHGALAIRTCRHVGTTADACRVVPGVLLSYEMLPVDVVESLLPLPACRVIVFTESVDLPPALVASITDDSNVSALQKKYFSALVAYLVSRSVQLVLCQKLVHPELRHELRRKGILFLERLSVQLAGPVLRMTGSRELAGVQPTTAWDASLGMTGGVGTLRLGSRQYVVIEPGPHAPPSCTVICAAATEPAAAEVERSVTAAIKLLYQTVAEPFVCAGGGATEALLAVHLRRSLREPLSPAGPTAGHSVASSSALSTPPGQFALLPRPVRAAFDALTAALESAALCCTPPSTELDIDAAAADDAPLASLFCRRTMQMESGAEAETETSDSDAGFESVGGRGGRSIARPGPLHVAFTGVSGGEAGRVVAEAAWAVLESEDAPEEVQTRTVAGAGNGHVFAADLEAGELGTSGAGGVEPRPGGPQETAGWVARGGAVLDSAAAKRLALLRACEAANVVLRCGGILPGVSMT